MSEERIPSQEPEPTALVIARAMSVIGREDVLIQAVPGYSGITGANMTDGYPPHMAEHRKRTERKLSILGQMAPADEGYQQLFDHVNEYIDGTFGPKVN